MCEVRERKNIHSKMYRLALSTNSAADPHRKQVDPCAKYPGESAKNKVNQYLITESTSMYKPS